MRIVFMGTPAYAAESLKALIQNDYEVAGVFTQPDRPKGRGGKVAMCEAKKVAIEHGIPVFQPRRIRTDGVESLKSLAPDLCVTAAFGQILSEEVLAIPRLGTVNVHASLLPEYRGSAPINWCIMMGETRTGVTTMMTDKGIDTGDILLQKETDILPTETAGELTERLARLGADLLIETLRRIQKGDCPRRKQDESRMSYYPMLKKEMGQIDWTQTAHEIACKVRGLNPWPGASTVSSHGVLKILAAHTDEGDEKYEPGRVLIQDSKQGLKIQTGQDALWIDVLQAPGGKAMAAKDYLRGHPLPAGVSFTEM